MPFDLIIWDCDGCLVDSEAIACGVVASYMTRLGYPLTGEDYISRFVGKPIETALQEVDLEKGLSLRSTFPYIECRQEILNVFLSALKATVGVEDVLQTISLEHCVASGSSVERNTQALQVTKLFSFFEGKIFSSSQVTHGKPAPDVFFYAAEKMGADPSRCLVIEDSVAGVTAGKAAGMTVFAYMGGSHVNAAWRERVAAAHPDAMFDDMRVLPEMVLNGFSSSSSRTSGSP